MTSKKKHCGGCLYPNAYIFSENRACVQPGPKWGYIKSDGTLTGAPDTPYEFDGCRSFSQGFAAVKKGDKFGYIEKGPEKKGDGSVIPVIDYHFEQARDFSEGLAAVKKDGKWGYIKKDYDQCIKQHERDEEKCWAIKPQYDLAYDFSEEGYAFVKQGEKWGYIDEKGNEITGFKFDDAPGPGGFDMDSNRGFSEGVGVVWNGTGNGYIKIEKNSDSYKWCYLWEPKTGRKYCPNPPSP